MLETILFNLRSVGRPTYKTHNGRKYLVAPLSLIVPGVLNGSQGPLFYSPLEIRKNHLDWNGIPLVSYHPQSLDGSHLSANDTAVLEKQGIGFVQGSQIARNGGLRAEGWFDVEKTRKVNNSILTALQSGQQIELSTGLYTDNIPAADGSNFNGKYYSHHATNYRPDHVAILPDQIGACSLNDGCGVYNQRYFDGALSGISFNVDEQTSTAIAEPIEEFLEGEDEEDECHCGGTCGKCGGELAANAESDKPQCPT